ncbi:MAG: chromate transporter [bacterium]|nr:chromate transporter [bacterium]
MNILISLFLTFWQIGLFSIGGGYAIIPLIQNQVVYEKHWVSEQVFTDIITISQMTPGPLAVNTSTFVGIQIAGISGALAATIGCVISGIVIALILYRFFQKHRESTYVFEVLNGLKAASLGLIVSAAATILLLTFFGSSSLSSLSLSAMDWAAAVVFAVSFFVLRKWKLNPILLMVLTGIVGAFLY